MAIIKPERMETLTKERKEAILRRSMEDISSIYLAVRDIVLDVQRRGDIVSIEHYRKFKEDINSDDLAVTREEIDKAYKMKVKEYHPDKIISKGLPEEFTKLAEDKFREIQEAYDVIRQERNMR